MRDSSSGWDLGPDLDHFSSRTRHVLQYMNPNKINMELLVDLIDYLGTTHHRACFRQQRTSSYILSLVTCVLNVFICVLCQTNPHSLRRWMEPFLCSSRVWLTSSSSTTCSPQTRGSGTKTGDIHKLIECTVIQYTLIIVLQQPFENRRNGFNSFICLTVSSDLLSF